MNDRGRWDSIASATGPDAEAREIEACFDRLWPIFRSITGEGVRRTHDILGEIIPLTRHEVPTGTDVFGWTVPKEWVVRDAYAIAPDGRRLFDVKENNLHLLNYSRPFRGTVSRAELDAHLHSLPHMPTAVPFVSSYYDDHWGFCVSQEQRDALAEGTYEVVIDTALEDGSLTLGENVLQGDSADEVLISSFTCHPSMANNELGGPLVLAFLHRRLARWSRRRLTYRFVLLPETIGSLTYLKMRGADLVERVRAGYVVQCCAYDGDFHYKRSRRGDSLADRAAVAVLGERAPGRFHVMPFDPDKGADERQYNAPGFNLPVGTIMRTNLEHFPEYHTSLDNKDRVSFPAMVETIDTYEAVCRAIDENVRYRSLHPFGEPKLSDHGLCSTLTLHGRPVERTALMWVLSFADGRSDLLDIAERSELPLSTVRAAAGRLREAGLVDVLDDGDAGGLPEFKRADQLAGF